VKELNEAGGGRVRDTCGFGEGDRQLAVGSGNLLGTLLAQDVDIVELR
jgi:hypothetical protein